MAAASVNVVEPRWINQDKGKGLFSTTNFSKGDVILTEKPIVSAQFLWNEMYHYEACEHCLRSLETAQEASRRLTNDESLVLPHPECCDVDQTKHTRCPACQVHYCSEQCRQESWQQNHKVLCVGTAPDDPEHPLNILKDSWRNIHYPPETSSIMLLAKMAAMSMDKSPEGGGHVQRFSQFIHTTVNEEDGIVHKLLGDQFKGQLQVLQAAARNALNFDHTHQEWLTDEGFKSVIAMIGLNGQGIASSSISRWVKNCSKLSLPNEEAQQLDSFIEQLYEALDKESGTFLDCEGSGLYALHSSCNHSCEPNAEVQFENGDYMLTLQALRDIEPEEEISINYLGECLLEHSRHTRQKILRENYLFTCTCPRCLQQADDPDETSEEEMSGEDEEEEEEEMVEERKE